MQDLIQENIKKCEKGRNKNDNTKIQRTNITGSKTIQ